MTSDLTLATKRDSYSSNNNVWCRYQFELLVTRYVSQLLVSILMFFISFSQSAVHSFYSRVKFAFENYGWSIRCPIGWVHVVHRGGSTWVHTFHSRLGIFSGHNGRDYIVAITKIFKFLFKVANPYFKNTCFRNLSFAKRYKSSPPLLYPWNSR